MVATIRETTEEEKDIATKISNIVKPRIRSLVEKVEEGGFGVIYEEGKEDILILTPYGVTVEWDFTKKSLDELKGEISNTELNNISVYATWAYSSLYKGKRPFIFPNLEL